MEAYRHGLFPMAYSAHSPYVNWICPDMRGQLSIPDLHIPRRLLHTLRRAPYEIRVDTAFDTVIGLCAEAAPQRPETWINSGIEKVFCQLHQRGHAHSVECWQDDQLVGGIYGLAMGGAFFGESMFSRARDASKIALVHLCARLWQGGFVLLDTQFINNHLEQFDAYELPHREYKKDLDLALQTSADFFASDLSCDEILNAYLDFRKKRGL